MDLPGRGTYVAPGTSPTFSPNPLTEEDIRRIFREELKKAKKS